MKRAAKDNDQPLMPFNEALKRVWRHAPMPKVKAKAQPAKPKQDPKA